MGIEDPILNCGSCLRSIEEEIWHYDGLDGYIEYYSDTQKFVQNIDQHLLESITNSQKNSVFHEGFNSIIRFLNASTFYDLLTPCTNFGVWLYNTDRLHFSLDIDNYETPLMAFRNKRATNEIRQQNSRWMEADIND